MKILARLALAFALLTLAASGAAWAATGGGVVVGLQLEPPILDPTIAAAAAIKDVTFPTVYEGLVRLGPGGQVEPLLATSWSVSPDGLSYTFHLRPSVRFQDGESFDAQAVKVSLDRARAPGSTNAQRPRFDAIAEVRPLDRLTVELRLKRRDGGLLQVLGWGDAAMVAPRSAAGDALQPVGTGPFRFVRWRRGYSIELARNAAYWGPPPHLERVTYRFIADPAAALDALEAGDVDIFPAFPAPESVRRLQADPRFTVGLAPSEGKVIMALNNARSPLSDIRVRRALSYAIDRRAVIDGGVFGLGQPIGSHYPPQDPGYVDLTGRYPYDPARARALLAAAGYPHGLALTLKLPPVAYARRSGEIVAAMLADVGVKVRIIDVEWAQWLDQVFGRHDYDMTIVDHVEPMDYDIYGRDSYYFGYHSPALQASLRALDDTTDPARRNALLGDIQRRIAEDAVNVFLFEPPDVGVWNARLKAVWAPTPVGDVDLDAARWDGPPPRTAGGGGGSPDWLWAIILAPIAAGLGFCIARVSPGYLAGRALALALTLAAASVLIFLLVQIVPGDPARYMMGLNADPEALHTLRAQLGLDAPAWRRYLGWVAGALHGDLGLSYTYRVPVLGLIDERLAVSLPLTLYALALSTAAAVAGSVWSAARPGGIADRAIGVLGQLGVSAPNFWIGMMLVVLFAAGLHWLPAGGFPGWAGGPGPALAALTLPALALAAPQAAVLCRVLRAELLSAMEADYIRTARARGLTRTQALVSHALPNAAAASLTILGLQFSFLLAGAVIVENVFALPGLGRLVLEAVNQRDLIVVQNVVVVLVLAVTVASFAVDLVASALDPRLGRTRG